MKRFARLEILLLIQSSAVKRGKNLDWLYSGDFESRYLDLQERRLKGTGEWVLQSPIFQNWINGKPGCLLLWGRAMGNYYSKLSFIEYKH